MPQTRRLAAIMFTDIVGYTALMGNDEQKAFQLLKRNREIQKPVIEEFGGTWIKELGDGVMASFNTVTDAVYAAIKIQEVCNRTNEFLLRIGIHPVSYTHLDVYKRQDSNGTPATLNLKVLFVWIKEGGVWKLFARQAVKV